MPLRLAPLRTALLFPLTALTLFAAPVSAAGGHHDHAPPHAMQLDHGKKWGTDAPLRQAMAAIRQPLAEVLPQIHRKTLTASGYEALAHQIERAVADMVAQCKLPPQADAQLHHVIGELSSGAERMGGSASAGERREGALRVVAALGNYARYFDNPGFKPLPH